MGKMNVFKRIVSMFLCVVLVLSAVPWNAYAQTEVSSNTVNVSDEPDPTEPTEGATAQKTQNTKNMTMNSDFVFIEPGRENDEPVGEVIITDQGYRVQMNPDLQSYTILEYLGSEKNVVIPSEFNELPITRLGAYAFSNKTALVTVQIPETITRIETGVFDGCTALTYHEYEGGKYLGSMENPYYYFCGPTDENIAVVTDGTMHSDTQIVAAFAFRGCESLKSVVVPNGVKQVGYGMLFGCDVESVTLPFVGELGTDKNTQFGWVFGARSMGGNISYVPMSLKTVVITGGEDGTQGTITQGAFYGVDMIEEITLPFLGGSADSTENAFISYYWGADSYTENIIPTSVKAVTVLEGVFGSSAFYGCIGLVSISILDGVTSVGGDAFSGCSSLTNVTIHGGVTSIGSNAFFDCSKLDGVYITDLTAWCKIQFENQHANPINNAKKLYINGVLATELTIPSDVTAIGNYVFYFCRSLTSITIPDSVTSIGKHAFDGCSSLTSVTIPDGVTSIGQYAFYDCGGLASITIPGSVTTIGGSAFFFCRSLKSITIPSSVTTIGNGAFSNCTGLYKVTNHSALSVTIGSGTNGAVAYNARILIHPDGSETYKNASSGYSYFETAEGFLFEKYQDTYTLIAYLGDADTVILPPTVNGKSYGIYEMRGVQSVIIPDGITSIDDSAFFGCSSLTSITIPDSITSIGSYAFYGCSFVDIILPDSVTSIDSGAFRYCSSLASITLPDSVTSIGSYAFRSEERRVGKECRSRWSPYH